MRSVSSPLFIIEGFFGCLTLESDSVAHSPVMLVPPSALLRCEGDDFVARGSQLPPSVCSRHCDHRTSPASTPAVSSSFVFCLFSGKCKKIFPGLPVVSCMDVFFPLPSLFSLFPRCFLIMRTNSRCSDPLILSPSLYKSVLFFFNFVDLLTFLLLQNDMNRKHYIRSNRPAISLVDACDVKPQPVDSWV